MDLSKQIKRMAQELDHFRDSYARKLGEHAETLLHCIQLANEERAKLAATEAHVATLRAALTTLRRWVNTCHHPERLEECGFCRETGRIDEALAATPGEALAGLKYSRIARELIRQSAIDTMAREVATLLNEMGADSPPPGTLFLDGVRLAVEGLCAEAGRARTVHELRNSGIGFDARAFRVGGPAAKAFMECAAACLSRADEIAKEGK